METQSPRADDDTPAKTTAPRWWTHQHTSIWEKAKQAFRRDWEQTKADLTSHGGRSLNQDAADTLRQAVGIEPPLPLAVKTRPTDPLEAIKVEEKAARHAAEVTAEANRTVAHARADIDEAHARLGRKVGDLESDLADHQQKADQEIGRAQDVAFTGIRKAQVRMGEAAEASVAEGLAGKGVIAGETAELTRKVHDVRKDLVAHQRKAGEEIAAARQKSADAVREQHDKINEAGAERDDAVARWQEAEQEARYGYALRSQYPKDHVWDDELDARLEREWAEVCPTRPWHESRPGILRGWDFAGKHG